MALALGVDTGGTYTDAVIIRDQQEIVASAKALTTRQDLSIGVGEAVSAVIAAAGIAPANIGLASLSTTLATNALVEGQGGRVALIYIGFQANDLERHGLIDALAGDPALVLAGGHNHNGDEVQPLDLTQLDDFIAAHRDSVSGFAVAGVFSTRNPSHEQAAAARIQAISGLPVTCSYQLSAKLNGPKRAVTAVLNARLIGMIDALILRAQEKLRELGVEAPMMVVRGDGALMSCDEARTRPIETILSGPAASIVGACWLTGCQTALISDIGGTTTDVALVANGQPKLDPEGARVGPHRTMVEAVAMRTSGLGGDSQVQLVQTGLKGGVTLGPKRLLPVSLLAQDAPEIVHRALDISLSAPVVSELDARFVRRVFNDLPSTLTLRERAVLDRITAPAVPISDVFKTRMDHGALNRLWERGLVQMCGITPSDASHVLGSLMAWDGLAAEKALSIIARRRTGAGEPLARSATALAQMIVDQLTQQTVCALLETVFAEDDAFDGPVEALVTHPLLSRALSGHRGLIALDAALNVDVVGLGASAATYYPAVGQRLNRSVILPQHAEVANAIGAIVGRLSKRATGTITTPREGMYRVHMEQGPRDFTQLAQAADHLEQALIAQADQMLDGVAAQDVTHSTTRDMRMAHVEGREIFVEGHITVEATARPRIASDT